MLSVDIHQHAAHKRGVCTVRNASACNDEKCKAGALNAMVVNVWQSYGSEPGG